MTDQHNPITPGEYDLALTVDADGAIVLHHSSMCDHVAAYALRLAAAALDARHSDTPCRPPRLEDLVDDDTLIEVPLNSSDGRLDADRRVWIDGAGHAWDLSLPWCDVTDREWRWTGRLDRGGRAPLMLACDTSGETEPLDAVRALYGPIAPAGGDAR